MHLDVFPQVLVALERAALPIAQLISALSLPYRDDVLWLSGMRWTHMTSLIRTDRGMFRLDMRLQIRPSREGR